MDNNLDGIFRFRMPLLRELKRRGYEIYVLVPYEPKYKYAIAELKKVSNIAFVHLKRTSIFILPDILFLVDLYKKLRKIDPDVTIAFTSKPIIYGTIASNWLKIKKTCSVITGLGYVFSGNNLFRKMLSFIVLSMYRVSLRKSSHIVFFNNDDLLFFIKKRVINRPREKYAEKNKIKVIKGNGIDLSEYQYSQPKINPITFFMAARFIKEKGILEYLQAARRMSEVHQDVIFLLAGKEDENPSSLSEEYIKLLANKCHVKYLGWVNIKDTLKEVSVYVLPSYREGLPRTIVEAMATGRPIITSYVPGCKETVIDGLNGFFVKAKDINSLYKAMEKFVINPELIPLMGKQSRRLCEDWFDLARIADEFIRYIDLS